MQGVTNIKEIDGYILGSSCLNPVNVKTIIDIIKD